MKNETANGTAKMIQTVFAEPMGRYKETSIDAKKKSAEFLLKSASPYYIRWADGRGEKVTKRQLEKLQAKHTWETDF